MRGPGIPTARITGWGVALPDKVVTNADFEARSDTSDEWIVERTGIRERRFGGTTSSLAVEAGREAIKRAGSADDVDLLYPVHHHPRSDSAGHLVGRSQRARLLGRRFRPERGLRRVRLQHRQRRCTPTEPRTTT